MSSAFAGITTRVAIAIAVNGNQLTFDLRYDFEFFICASNENMETCLDWPSSTVRDGGHSTVTLEII